MKPAALFASLWLIVGCGGGGGGGGGGGSGGGGGDLASTSPADLSSSASPDLASGTTSTDMAGGSGLCCGQPGDAGNELGVGKYCSGFGDCTGMANLCSTLGDPQLHFCTMVCQMGGNCGTGATCQCQGGQCGCFPDSCMNMPSTC
ncbi:MAG: hypothetical protein JWM53_1613 [bacterium]|nr:hypothetical protein [bacterium]